MRKRWDLLVFGMLVLAPLVFAVLVLTLRRASAADEAELVARAIAVLTKSHPRTPHESPTEPGSFGDAIEPWIDHLGESRRRLGDEDLARWSSLATGGSESTEAIEAELHAVRPAVDALRLATRRTLGDPPRSVHPFDDRWQDWGVPALEHGTRAALIGGWRHLRDERSEEALSLCLDIFAVGRDLSFGGAFYGRSVAGGIQREAAPLCAASLGRVDPARRQRAGRQLQVILAGHPSWRDTFREDAVGMELLLLGPFLSDAARLSLPEAAQNLALKELDRPDRTAKLAWIFVPDSWREIVSYRRSAEEVLDLPEAARAAALQAIDRRAIDSVNLLLPLQRTDYSRFLERGEVVRRMFEALQQAAISAPGDDLPMWSRDGSSWVYEMASLSSDRPPILLTFSPTNVGAQAASK